MKNYRCMVWSNGLPDGSYLKCSYPFCSVHTTVHKDKVQCSPVWPWEQTIWAQWRGNCQLCFRRESWLVMPMPKFNIFKQPPFDSSKICSTSHIYCQTKWPTTSSHGRDTKEIPQTATENSLNVLVKKRLPHVNGRSWQQSLVEQSWRSSSKDQWNHC